MTTLTKDEAALLELLDDAQNGIHLQEMNARWRNIMQSLANLGKAKFHADSQRWYRRWEADEDILR